MQRRAVQLAVIAAMATGAPIEAAELRAGIYKYDGAAAIYAMQDSQHYICDDCPRPPALQKAHAFLGEGFVAHSPVVHPAAKPVAETETPVVAEKGPFAEVFFRFDESKMRTEEKRKLKERIASLDPGVPVEVEGYACKIGTRPYNMKLSMRRAKSVAAYIKSLGVTVASVSWHGEDGSQEGPLKKHRKAVIQVKER